MMKEKVFCKRCAIDAALKNADAELDAYIKSIDPLLKADQKTYYERLSLCEKCDNMVSGICRHCGCFVRARAIKKHMCCPLSKPKW